MSIPKLQQSQLLSSAGAPAHGFLHCCCPLMCYQIRQREALINPARVQEPGEAGGCCASCQSTLTGAGIQNGEQRSPVGHWCLEYFALCLPLPRAFFFSMEGVWESQCTEGQKGGHLTQVRMQGFPLLPCFSPCVKIQRSFEPCGTLTRHLWGVTGQGYCVVVSEHTVSNTGRESEGEGINSAAKTFRARGQIWLCAHSRHTCRFLQFVAVTTSSGTQGRRI